MEDRFLLLDFDLAEAVHSAEIADSVRRRSSARRDPPLRSVDVRGAWILRRRGVGR